MGWIMDVLVADFETYYDKDYSLKVMPSVQYVRDPRFHIFGCSMKWNQEDSIWVPGPQIRQYIEGIKPDIIVGHRVLFDGTVWTEKFNLKPTTYWVDTIGLARAILPHQKSYALEHIATIFGGKGKPQKAALDVLKGVRHPTLQQLADLGKYAIDDCDDCALMFYRMWDVLPDIEKLIMHLTLRAGVEPQLVVDIPRITAARDAALAEQKEKVNASGVTSKVLCSNDQFAAWIVDHGMTPPMKTSPTTGKKTYAFSKGDLEFVRFMANHPVHKSVWEARLAAKSNIQITRAQRILDVGETGPFPMPYNYYAAHTGRTGGTDKLNVANLVRGGEMRKSLTAPPGYLVCAGDSGQIELRGNCWFSDQLDTIKVFLEGGDVYLIKAAEALGIPVDDVQDHQRTLEKVKQLGLGYRMGWKVFQVLCALGPYGNDPIYFNDGEAKYEVDAYRLGMDKVAQMWTRLDQIIPDMSVPSFETEIHGIKFAFERVELPNGMLLQYPNLRYETDPKTGRASWMYSTRKFLHGGTLLENIIQALARIIVVGIQMPMIDKHPLIRVVGQTYDEVITLIPESHQAECEQYILECMATDVPWAKGWPLKADIKTRPYYAK
jgi:DNA polymerase